MRRNPNKVKCTGTNKAGKPCRKWAVPGADPALCDTHRDLERWHAISKRGGEGNARRHRKHRGPDPRAGLDPEVPLSRVLELLRNGLEADFREVGLPRETDWSTRLLSLLVVVTLAPDAFKDVEAAPAFSDVYVLARSVWRELKRRPDIRSQLVALYMTEYPPALEQPAA
jgi:hypothetical protein